MRTIALVVLFAFSTACMRHHTIAPEELRKLDGYSLESQRREPIEATAPNLRFELLPPGTLRLQDTDGQRFEFNESSRLRIDGAEGTLAEGSLTSARVNREELLGQFDDQSALHVPLAQVVHADVANVNRPATVLLVLAVVTALVLAAFPVGLALNCANNPHCE